MIDENQDTLRRRDEDENVPEAMHVGEIDRQPEATEETVTQPSRQGQRPQNATTHAHVVHSRTSTPAKHHGMILRRCCGRTVTRFCNMLSLLLMKGTTQVS